MWTCPSCGEKYSERPDPPEAGVVGCPECGRIPRSCVVCGDPIRPTDAAVQPLREGVAVEGEWCHADGCQEEYVITAAAASRLERIAEVMRMMQADCEADAETFGTILAQIDAIAKAVEVLVVRQQKGANDHDGE